MIAIDETHDPKLTSWVPGADGHRDFAIQNLPYGIFSIDGGDRRPAVAIGDRLLDLSAITWLLPVDVTCTKLNALFTLAPERRLALRRKLSSLLSEDSHRAAIAPHLHDLSAVTMHLPAAIGDYTDFYVGIHHAMNIGRQLRPDNPLLPNYKYVPIGYHGRASSIRPSGVPVVRPKGQRKPSDADAPVVGPSARLDYELELGVWIGRGNELGEPIPIDEAADHIAGFCLLNDWSARDLQAWEYQPLGPFLAKSFQSTISPWVVTAEAMAPFRIAQPSRPEGDPKPLPYLWDETDQARGALAIELEVQLLTAQMREAGMAPQRLSKGPASNMYWTVAQIVTHHASNGCNLSPGDLLGTGTISAPTEDGFGSLMELSRGGSQPVKLPNGEERGFLADGDEVILSATARAEGFAPIGFGECRGVVLPGALMTIDQRLAVYGTLAPGRSNHQQLAGLAGHWRAGSVRGRLVAEGWAATEGYPALFLDPDGPVIEIQLFESPDLPRHWGRLDDFEGPGYRRAAVIVSIGDDVVDAWIYAAV